MRRLLPLALLAGCSWTTYQATNPPPSPLHPRPKAEVEILKAPPTGRGFVEVGVFDVTLNSYGRLPGEDPKVERILKDKGAQRGCQAVVLESQTHIDDGLSTRDKYRARCLVF